MVRMGDMLAPEAERGRRDFLKLRAEKASLRSRKEPATKDLKGGV